MYTVWYRDLRNFGETHRDSKMGLLNISLLINLACIVFLILLDRDIALLSSWLDCHIIARWPVFPFLGFGSLAQPLLTSSGRGKSFLLLFINSVSL